ncbi:hydrogenase maturation nickel metallochaperone HypA [Sodalis sp. dw_96]|uniref:hydrogenase maturation nickel metallochaperone HypA n=1 Tax=Sodalis sp. dw_96 TaxID=2719794 RepID=UPI001BD3909D|nr:hydrogenase maturation nickel metallochaperone HypA [Sodalis sp. dw_96]
MHELTLCQNALELAEQHARRHGARRVTAVWMEIGTLSCVEENALRFCFDIVCNETLAKGCQLHLTWLKAQAKCLDCDKRVAIAGYHEGCPECGGFRLWIESGDSLRITQIEVE